MSKSFGIFNKLGEKHSEVNKTKLEVLVRPKKGFTHVQSSVFASLYTLPEFNYLNRGLYVANDHLKATKDMLDLFDYSDDQWPEEKIRGVAYQEAVTIVNKYDYHMMTPTEFLCVYDAAMDSTAYPELEHSFINNGQAELLGACLHKSRYMYTHSIGEHINVLNEVKFPDRENNNVITFDRGDTDPKTGIPFELKRGGRYNLWLPFDHWVMACWYDLGGPSIDYSRVIHQKEVYRKRTSIRACIKVKEEDLL